MSLKIILAAAALTFPASIAFAQADTTAPAPDAAAPAADAAAAASTDATAPAADAAVGASADAAASAPAADTGGATAAAAAADVSAGATVLDTSGATVGTIEKVEGDKAVLSTGSVRVGIPVSAIGKNDRGLVIAMSKSEVEAAAKANSATN
jgi:hypothetical protein